MNVLLVSSKYPPEYSGSGNRAHATSLRLRERFGNNVETICSSVEITESENYEVDGIQTSRVISKSLRKIDQSFGKGQFRRITNAAVYHAEARSVRKLLKSKNYDLIHVFGYSPATVAAVNWSRDHAIPLMLEIVNNVISPYQYLPGTRRFRSYDLSKQAVIVAISRHLAELSESVGLTTNVWTRPNPVDTSRFFPVSEQDRASTITQQFGFDEADKVIVYVAKFMKQKNHEFLVDAMTHLPENFKLVLAGPTVTSGELDPGMTADQLPEFLARINAKNLSDRVKVVADFVDIAEFLKGADVFCFPAENEAMGTPLLEALASGTPTVANKSEPSFAEWITDEENGFLVELDAQKWAVAIQKSAEFGEARNNGISTAIKARVSSEVIDAQYFQLMTKLVNSTPDQTVDVAQVLSS
jgi:glycosyltransferase involved in cell wall biosynthesis